MEMEKCQGVYLQSDGSGRMAYRFTMNTAYIGLKVGESCCPIRNLQVSGSTSCSPLKIFLLLLLGHCGLAVDFSLILNESFIFEVFNIKLWLVAENNCSAKICSSTNFY